MSDKKQATKAVWSTAFVNNLPDAAFAVVLPGGKKDGEGKTVPRSLRLLPHHNGNVKSSTENSSVDLTHLRNALARVNQINAPASTKTRAKSHLEAHARALLASHRERKKNMTDQATTETATAAPEATNPFTTAIEALTAINETFKSAGQLSSEAQEQLLEVVASLAAMANKSDEEDTADLESTMSQMDAMIQDLSSDSEQEGDSEPDAGTGEAESADGDAPSEPAEEPAAGDPQPDPEPSEDVEKNEQFKWPAGDMNEHMSRGEKDE